eukprot:CAMPEP_0198423340 /NCGR_PEP_ID=MMETSP1452-20131203/3036_1 /TAXON_ID=1181717 /ORGANISM="Synchroma pusillum, Strain CCMP3072" /LENGTH=140 /DNA_ID=CAMNT_0044143639 /DNA_START=70 /DNA_END=490 /DNA_ORIENTATION=+
MSLPLCVRVNRGPLPPSAKLRRVAPSPVRIAQTAAVRRRLVRLRSHALPVLAPPSAVLAAAPPTPPLLRARVPRSHAGFMFLACHEAVLLPMSMPYTTALYLCVTVCGPRHLGASFATWLDSSSAVAAVNGLSTYTASPT